MEGGVEVEPPNIKFEYTPTWIIAVVCSIIVLISFCAERGLHRLGKLLLRKGQDALYEALQKLKEELMLLGFISLLLTVLQRATSRICMPPNLANYMLPCKRPTSISHSRLLARHLSSTSPNTAGHCVHKGMVPLVSSEALHQLHIFIFVLAVVHVVFCATTMFLATAKIQQWKAWEDWIKHQVPPSKRERVDACHNDEFVEDRVQGFWRKAAVITWLTAFAKQFHGSITKAEYLSLRRGFIQEHCPQSKSFDFYTYVTRSLLYDFKQVVGISWYLWVFVVLFLLLNLRGWHTYFWLSFLPLIVLVLVGAKLEHIMTRLAQESDRRLADKEAQPHRNKQSAVHEVKPSDQHFWFSRPSLVLHLIHFILFQNSFEIAFFFWIWTTYGFKSCIMEQPGFIITRLFMGVIVQVLCSYSTLPLYALVSQMGSTFKKGMFDKMMEEALILWAEEAKRRVNNADSEKSLVHDTNAQQSSHPLQIAQPTAASTSATDFYTHDSIVSEPQTH